MNVGVSRAAILAAVLVAAGGCGGSSRRVQTDAQLKEGFASGMTHRQTTFKDAVGRLMDRTAKEVEAATPSSPATLDILAISGGGDYGAFGAGVLVGWGMSQDPSWKRPDFDAVTGVSTGALISPFAYIGSDASCLAVESFYRNPKSDWVESRGMLFFWPSNPSFMMLPGLHRDVGVAVDKKIVDEMAAQSRRGKLLLVSATDLDYGVQHVWDVGMEAEKAVETGKPDDLKRVQQTLLASAAIPAIFPPIEIDGKLYADGGVTANVFVKLDPDSPEGFLQRWIKAYPNTPLPKVRYWVIFNNQMHQPPATVQPTWPDVMSPSLSTSIRSATLSEIKWLAAEIKYVNCRWKTDIELRVVAIPDQWRPPVTGDFKKTTMDSLADLGRTIGADPNAWHLLASPQTGQ